MSTVYDSVEKSGGAFLTKTYAILQNPSFNKIISWNNEGKMIQIRNTSDFEEEILSKFFKHKNIKSFIRQLNMYGFRKTKKGNVRDCFYHPCFTKGRKEDIKLIKRRKNCRILQLQNYFKMLSNKIEPVISKTNIGSQETITAQLFKMKQFVFSQNQLPNVDYFQKEYTKLDDISNQHEDVFFNQESFKI